MQDIIIEKSKVNAAALDADLRIALGENLLGISTGPYGVCVHLADEATPAQIEQTRSIVQSHDPAKLTPSQQAALDSKARLVQARQNYGETALDLTTFNGQSALIQKLAQKIAWLEQEITDLRGGVS